VLDIAARPDFVAEAVSECSGGPGHLRETEHHQRGGQTGERPHNASLVAAVSAPLFFGGGGLASRRHQNYSCSMTPILRERCGGEPIRATIERPPAARASLRRVRCRVCPGMRQISPSRPAPPPKKKHTPKHTHTVQGRFRFDESMNPREKSKENLVAFFFRGSRVALDQIQFVHKREVTLAPNSLLLPRLGCLGNSGSRRTTRRLC